MNVPIYNEVESIYAEVAAVDVSLEQLKENQKQTRENNRNYYGKWEWTDLSKLSLTQPPNNNETQCEK